MGTLLMTINFPEVICRSRPEMPEVDSLLDRQLLSLLQVYDIYTIRAGEELSFEDLLTACPIEMLCRCHRVWHLSSFTRQIPNLNAGNPTSFIRPLQYDLAKTLINEHQGTKHYVFDMYLSVIHASNY